MFKNLIYGLLWLSIGLVSAIDIYWSIVLQDVLIETELNPLGKILIESDGGSVALFMFCKVVGLVVALGLLVILYHYKKRIAWLSILGVFIFQAWLLWYLNAVPPSIMKKVKFYRNMHQKVLKEVKCPPTITPVLPVNTPLRPNTVSTKTLPPVPNAETANLGKSSTRPPSVLLRGKQQP
tara:strand:- start:4552 stop:5091 length:540 start_codon:yes stop_codon:yes gene_type:complete